MFVKRVSNYPFQKKKTLNRCGSAAFGGWLADKYDYTYSFLITAIFQTVGIMIWSTLLPLVPRTEGNNNRNNEEVEDRETNDDDVDVDSTIEPLNSLQEPLLASSEGQT